MKLEDLKFWVSPLSHELFVGSTSKRDPTLVLQKREITGTMINGIVELMVERGWRDVDVTQRGKRYRLSTRELQPDEVQMTDTHTEVLRIMAAQNRDTETEKRLLEIEAWIVAHKAAGSV